LRGAGGFPSDDQGKIDLKGSQLPKKKTRMKTRPSLMAHGSRKSVRKVPNSAQISKNNNFIERKIGDGG